MAPTAVDLATEVLEAVSARDVDRLFELTDPEVEWQSFFADLLAGGAYHGHEGIRQYVHDLDDAFELVHAGPEGGVGVGDVALVLGTVQYRGKESGVESEEAAGWMMRFRAGRCTEFRAFREPEKVLGSVGR